MKTFASFAGQNLSGSSFGDESTCISVQSMGRAIYISPDSITFLEGEGNYTFIYLNTGKRYLISKTLKSLAENLSHNFIRVHKSYLINADYVVERLEDDRMLKMACGKEVVVSRRKIKEISSLLDHSSRRISA